MNEYERNGIQSLFLLTKIYYVNRFKEIFELAVIEYNAQGDE